MFRLAEKFEFHPITLSVPLATGRNWRGGGGWCYEQKIDGIRAGIADGQCFGRSRARPFIVPASLNNCRLDGELAGGVFYAFDLLTLHGQDLRREPLHFRRAALSDLLRTISCTHICPVPSGSGGEFLEAILARGGEGVVAKHLASFYGEPESWVKCKRTETHDCLITEIHPARQSIRLGARGWCAVLGRAFAQLKPGDVVEIACHSLTAAGKFREPRFLRARPDKPASACPAL